MSESETSPTSDRQDDDLPTAEDVRGILRQDAPMPSKAADRERAHDLAIAYSHHDDHNSFVRAVTATWRKLFIEGRAPDDAARRAEVDYKNSLPLIERRKEWLAPTKKARDTK